MTERLYSNFRHLVRGRLADFLKIYHQIPDAIIVPPRVFARIATERNMEESELKYLYGIRIVKNILPDDVASRLDIGFYIKSLKQ